MQITLTESQLTSTAHENLDCIRNGLISEGIGHRAVAFMVDQKGDVKIRAMISQKSTEKYYGWNSGVQSLKKDDFVVISSWTPKSEKIQVFRRTNRGLVPTRTHGGSYRCRLLERLPDSIRDFLKPRGGGPSYLPSGPWRAQYDMNENMQRKRIESFLKDYLSGDWFTYVVQEAQKAPEQHLIVDWHSHKVQSLPATLCAHEEFWTKSKDDDSDVYVYNSMVWVLIHSCGKIEIVEPDPTSGHHYTGPSRRIIETFRALPKTMPSTVVKAIKINLGAYEKDERSYGARWYLYKRTN